MAPSNVVTISQPADDSTVIVMIGQRVERVCGACYPVEGGTVIGFEDVPDGRFFRGGVFAWIRWDDCPDHPERVRLSDISPPRLAVRGRLRAGRVRGRINNRGRRKPPPPFSKEWRNRNEII